MDDAVAHRLLAFVRAVMAHELGAGPAPVRPEGWADRTHGGAFVTLTRGGRLRGCMGTFYPQSTVLETVEAAARSAVHDPRFESHPVTAPELNQIQVEVSILGLPERTASPLTLTLGRHGVWIRRGPASGCFLPHVALERGWSVEEFLSNCCTMKAGLPADAWKDPETEVLLYEAEVLADPA